MNTFFLIFIGIPAIEIFLLIKIGGEIGALSTIALIFLTAIIGIFYARIQGIQTLRAGLINIYQNKTPFYELISGASIAFASLLLIVPGFFTDFILLVPTTRNIMFKILLRKKNNSSKTTNKNKTIDGEIIDKKKDEL